MDTKKKEKIVDGVFKLCLIIIIIILLVHNCQLIKLRNNELIPTGNVEIIEINCDKDDTCIIEDGGSNGNKGTTKPVSGDDDIIQNDNGMIVHDTGLLWSGNTEAKIFTNSMYRLEGVIAPESSNTYQFVVLNNSYYKLNYNINLVEDNPYYMNLKYKLKKNDTYIVDHYVSASEISIATSALKPSKSDTYYLEWKWISSNNDTEVGANPQAKYKLSIEVKAESTDD